MKDSATPTFSVSTEGNITITIPSTQAQLKDQGYTYNQSGQTYNQAGVMYGGVYNYNQDFIPMLYTITNPTPNDISFTDIYFPYVPPPLYKAIPLGPGFFMFIPQ
jgi:hypothetical protein